MLKDDIRRVAEDLLDPLGETDGSLETCFLFFRCLIAGPHHVFELVAVDVVDGAQLFDQLALFV